MGRNVAVLLQEQLAVIPLLPLPLLRLPLLSLRLALSKRETEAQSLA